MKWKWSHTINPKWEWFQYEFRLRPLYSIINILVHSIVACFCCKNCSFHTSRLSVNTLAGHSFEDQSTKTYCTINIVFPAIFSNGIGDIVNATGRAAHFAEIISQKALFDEIIMFGCVDRECMNVSTENKRFTSSMAGRQQHFNASIKSNKCSC